MKYQGNEAFYGSIRVVGTGGGTSGGGIRGLQYTDDNFANSDGTRDYDKIYAWNSGSAI
jgi:hypothetical protein